MSSTGRFSSGCTTLKGISSAAEHRKRERRFLLQHAMFRFMVESVTEKNYQSIDRGKAERQRRDMCWETLSQTAQTSYNLYKLQRSSSVLYFIFSVVEVSVRTENCCVFLSFQRFTHMRVVHGLMAFFFGGFFLHSSSLHRGMRISSCRLTRAQLANVGMYRSRTFYVDFIDSTLLRPETLT